MKKQKKMVTYYNKKDLIDFGKYLLSKEREERLRQSSIENPNSLPYDEKFRDVFDADFRNWIDSK